MPNAATKVYSPIVSLNFPIAGSWPPPVIDWTRNGGIDVATWLSADNIQWGVGARDYFYRHTTPAQSQYGKIKYISTTATGAFAFITLALRMNTTDPHTGNNYQCAFYPKGGDTTIYVDGATVATLPATQFADGSIFSFECVQLSKGFLLVAYVNGVAVLSYIDTSADVSLPGPFLFDFAIAQNTAAKVINFGDVEFGKILFPTPINLLPTSVSNNSGVQDNRRWK